MIFINRTADIRQQFFFDLFFQCFSCVFSDVFFGSSFQNTIKTSRHLCFRASIHLIVQVAPLKTRDFKINKTYVERIPRLVSKYLCFNTAENSFPVGIIF